MQLGKRLDRRLYLLVHEIQSQYFADFFLVQNGSGNVSLGICGVLVISDALSRNCLPHLFLFLVFPPLHFFFSIHHCEIFLAFFLFLLLLLFLWRRNHFLCRELNKSIVNICLSYKTLFYLTIFSYRRAYLPISMRSFSVTSLHFADHAFVQRAAWHRILLLYLIGSFEPRF